MGYSSGRQSGGEVDFWEGADAAGMSRSVSQATAMDDALIALLHAITVKQIPIPDPSSQCRPARLVGARRCRHA